MTGAEREAMILSLAPLVKHLAYVRWVVLPRSVMFDDILSAAWLGAIAAVDGFEPARGSLLATYARWKISGAIGDYLRGEDTVSRDERIRLKKNPDEEPPRTFSINARHDNGGRVFEIGDKRSLEAVRRLEARHDLAMIIRRSGANPRFLRILTRHAHGENMKAISQSEGINESRVSQICKKTREKLRAAA